MTLRPARLWTMRIWADGLHQALLTDIRHLKKPAQDNLERASLNNPGDYPPPAKAEVSARRSDYEIGELFIV